VCSLLDGHKSPRRRCRQGCGFSHSVRVSARITSTAGRRRPCTYGAVMNGCDTGSQESGLAQSADSMPHITLHCVCGVGSAAIPQHKSGLPRFPKCSGAVDSSVPKAGSRPPNARTHNLQWRHPGVDMACTRCSNRPGHTLGAGLKSRTPPAARTTPDNLKYRAPDVGRKAFQEIA
jgi:hypothetical protein